MEKWQRGELKLEQSNPFWEYYTAGYTTQDGHAGTYHLVHTRGSAFVVPVDDVGNLLLVRQYRFPVDDITLEFPGGGMREGGTPEEVARKELIEETGFGGVLRKIGEFYPYPGVSTETCHVFLARDLVPSREFLPDESEHLELVRLPVDAWDAMVQSGQIRDGMSLSIWALARFLVLHLTG